MPLNERQRQQLDGIVERMLKDDESNANIRSVVDDFKGRYEPRIEVDTTSAIDRYAQSARGVPGILVGAVKQGVDTVSALGDGARATWNAVAPDTWDVDRPYARTHPHLTPSNPDQQLGTKAATAAETALGVVGGSKLAAPIAGALAAVPSIGRAAVREGVKGAIVDGAPIAGALKGAAREVYRRVGGQVDDLLSGQGARSQAPAASTSSWAPTTPPPSSTAAIAREEVLAAINPHLRGSTKTGILSGRLSGVQIDDRIRAIKVARKFTVEPLEREALEAEMALLEKAARQRSSINYTTGIRDARKGS